MPGPGEPLDMGVTHPRAFAVTWDYRCPFARNVHEHLIEGLRAGAEWNVDFVPFSLGQVHLEDGERPIWDHWQDDTGLLALQAGVTVRDKFPDRFLDVHEALFALRHDHGGQLREESQVRGVLEDQGVDAGVVLAEIATGGPIDTVRREHEAAARGQQVWGVPTFIVGDRAAFVRLMDRPRGDGAHATSSIDKVVHLLHEFPGLNEFKYTSIPR